jgi:hypothetical protein
MAVGIKPGRDYPRAPDGESAVRPFAGGHGGTIGPQLQIAFPSRNLPPILPALTQGREFLVVAPVVRSNCIMLHVNPVKAILTSTSYRKVRMPDPNRSQSSAEKRKIDEKLDDALEESFPGSDPASISQPAPEQKPQKPKT